MNIQPTYEKLKEQVEDLEKTNAQLLQTLKALTGSQEKSHDLPGESPDPAIIERKDAEADVRLFRNLVNQSNDAIFVIEPQTSRFLDVNNQACTILGFEKEELLKLGVVDIDTLLPADFIWEEHIDEVRERGSMLLDTVISRKDGAMFQVEANIKIIEEDDQKYYVSVLRDISERKQVEDALRQSRERYRDLIETVNDIIWEVDINGDYAYVSPRIKDVLGCEPKELLGTSFLNQIIPEERQRAAENLRKVVVEKKTFGPDENTVIHKNGCPVILENSGKPFFSADGKLLTLRGIARDITNRKMAEKAIQESERRYRLLAENVTDVIWTTDMNMDFDYISPSVTGLLGYDIHEVMTLSTQKFMNSASFTLAMNTLNKAIIEDQVQDQKILHKSYMLELELFCKDGSSVWTENTLNLIRDASGKPTGIIGISRDISTRKLAEAERRQTEERYRLLIDNSISPITVHDRDGMNLIMNRAAAELLNGKPEDFVGRDIREYFPEQSEFLKDRFRNVIDTGKGVEFEDIVRFPSGIKWFWSNFQPVRDVNGNIFAVQSISYDITERKRAEKALEKSEERLSLALQATTDGIWDWDVLKNEVYASVPFKEFFGFDEDLEGLLPSGACASRIHPSHRKRFFDNFQKALDGNAHFNDDYLVRDKTNQYLWHNVRGIFLFDEDGKAFRMVGSIRDIHDSIEKQEHIRALTQQLLKAQEIERQRIARELHDNVAQDLAASKMTCGLILDRDQSLPNETKGGILKIADMLGSSLAAVRDLSYDLRPPDLEDWGLVPAISLHCNDFTEKTGIAIEFRPIGIHKANLDFDDGIHVFRLIQEGLNNIRKHAAASKVTVKLIGAFPNFIVRIEDNGKGFDVKSRIPQAMKEKRMGLRNMKERVNLLQGEMEIHSKPNAGTVIAIKFSYRKSEDAFQKEEKTISGHY